jgi:alpha-tubulin suppressor-like RCC1 family protein
VSRLAHRGEDRFAARGRAPAASAASRPSACLLAALLVALSSLCACIEPPLTLGAQCIANSDCETPLVCRLARCRNACIESKDCPPGQLCVLDAQRLGACTLPGEETCSIASDCPSPLVCGFGRCTNECMTREDCVTGAVCRFDPESGGNRCFEAVVPVSCVSDGDCLAPAICGANGLCRPICRVDSECPRGYRCADDACVPATDGSIDASFDGGLDASFDAHLPDAAPPDGALPDASMPDAAGDAGMSCMMPGDCPSGPRSTPTCIGRVCGLSCTAGFDDCDRDPSTGCEADLSSTSSCRACGTRCGAGLACEAGGCEVDAIVEIDAGTDYACVRRASGEVVCWGNDCEGELGDGAPIAPAPAGPRVVPGIDAIDIAAGRTHACAVIRDGTVSCWGSNDLGGLGRDPAIVTESQDPLAVPGVTGVAEVDAGDRFTCVRMAADGSVRCWGNNRWAQLGDGTDVDRFSPAPVMGTPPAFVELAAGENHICARTAANAVYCWGERRRGQFGDGIVPHFGVCDLPSGTGSCLPAPTLTPLTATSLTAGEGFTCMIGLDGDAYCVGDGNAGRLGDGLSRETSTPVRVAGPLAPDEIAAGRRHACARIGGTMRCWGTNLYGAAGVGSMLDSFSTPAAAALTDAAAMALGDEMSCALRTSGRVSCWGAERRGLTGGGTCMCGLDGFGRPCEPAPVLAPVEVSGS